MAGETEHAWMHIAPRWSTGLAGRGRQTRGCSLNRAWMHNARPWRNRVGRGPSSSPRTTVSIGESRLDGKRLLGVESHWEHGGDESCLERSPWARLEWRRQVHSEHAWIHNACAGQAGVRRRHVNRTWSEPRAACWNGGDGRESPLERSPWSRLDLMRRLADANHVWNGPPGLGSAGLARARRTRRERAPAAMVILRRTVGSGRS